MINNKYPNISPSLNLDFTNSNTIDPRITFSRASAATYYDGKTVAKAEENLLPYSEQFDNAAWTKTNSTILPNTAVAPDGTITADKVMASAVSGYHNVYQNYPFSDKTHTVSVYAKPAEYSKLKIADSSTANFSAEFDIATGVVINFIGVSASITRDSLTGWCRCSIVFSATATAKSCTLIGYPDSGATQNGFGVQYTGDGTSGIYIWGAQLEQRSQVTAYTPTTTQPITNYIPVLQTALANVPRIDHDPVTGECKGLLIEEQRTNLLPYSEQFDNTAWAKSLVTIQPNGTVAPDGTQTADKLVPGTGTATYVSSTAIGKTLSVYAKASGKSTLLLYSGVAGSNAYFNLTTGAVGTKLSDVASTSIVSMGNGWYRCSVTWITDSTAVRIYAADSDGSLSATGDGYSGIYIWGAQLEAGAFPTSYIKTEASQVTRAADSAAMTGANFSSWYRRGEGTLTSDVSWDYGSNAVPSNRIAVMISSDVATASDNRVMIYNINGAAGGSIVQVGGVNQAAFQPGAQTAAFTKTAFAFAANNFAASIAGATAMADVSGQMPTATNLLIGSHFGNLGSLNGHIKRITYYPKRLSDAQLQALTA